VDFSWRRFEFEEKVILFPPKLLKIMIDNIPYILAKKWECPNKIAVWGGWGLLSVGAVAASCSEGFAEIHFLFYNLSEKKPDSIPEGAK